MSCACFHAQKSAEFAGYHSPSSGDSPEKIYATPSDDDDDDREWYSESPPRRELTAAEIREFEEELDALSSQCYNRIFPGDLPLFSPEAEPPFFGALQCLQCWRD